MTLLDITKGSEVTAVDGRVFENHGFLSMQYSPRLDKLAVTLFCREKGKEYIQIGVARVYNAPVYTSFEVAEWDGRTISAGKLTILLERFDEFNKIWGCSFPHCRMTINPVGWVERDVLKRESLIKAYSLPAKA